MKKYIVTVVGIISILLTCLIGGCAEGTKVDYSHVPDNCDTGERIIANHFRQIPGEYVHFCGCSTLPDGTYLQTQVYVDGKPEAWWPADRYIKVQNGKWQINVRLGENGAPQAVRDDTHYVFKVWEKDNPSVMATFPFDLIPPPSGENSH